MATVSEILTKAADLLEKPGAWTQGDYARNYVGEGYSDYIADRADEGGTFEPVCFCTIGALNHVRGKEADAALWGELRNPVVSVVGEINIADWNDTPGRTQAEVVAALRTAASQAEGNA